MAAKKLSAGQRGAQNTLGVLTSNLSFLRFIRRYTMGELGTVCDVSQPTLRKLLKDPRDLTIGQLLAISELADINPCDMLSYQFYGGD